ncbi:hypothetical protein AVEN_83688-1 [Araneus ventricosus]|uniref:Uncharacterized protein n=1 Tax=Araneus ventricosus TaxID=182803 RepID=A0A4Y2EWD7_ARAVE|nr:hypothetical protein AVEN_83688-1 [Araneus ventricosus]
MNRQCGNWWLHGEGEVNAEVGTNPVDTVDNGDPREADKAEIQVLMEKALNSERTLNALIATSGLNQAKKCCRRPL